jgi:hypothetical protein
MVNRNLLPSGFVWYDEDYTSAEELELIFKLFKYGEVRNLKEKLLYYRIHNNNTSLINPRKTFYLTLKTRLIAILKYGYKPTLKGVLITLSEAIFVSLIPNVWIYPVYSFIRGMRRIDISRVRINLDVGFIFKKAYQLVKA